MTLSSRLWFTTGISDLSESTWTVPVFGDDDGEPCHGATFAASWCQQAWRWNLDLVIDPNGNAITYTYVPETNHYGRNLKPEDETPYTRGGYLKEIGYGLREGALTAKPSAKVIFDTSERCMEAGASDCDPANISAHPEFWWDVPWDMNCNSGQDCKDDHGTVAPTFWSRKRLTKVTTQVIKSDATTYRNVDSWAMDHTWGLADVDRDLLLGYIQQTGHAGTTAVTLPKVTFNHVQLPNRLDVTGDDILPYIRYRVGAIYDESGGQIDVNYSTAECSVGSTPTPETNTKRCFPVWWQPPGRDDPIEDWFHKYVVTSVIQTDRTGLAPDMNTQYEYLGGAAWHYDDDDGLTKEKYKTWSQWRGYGQVRVKTGDFNSPSTQADTFYLRGMDGDRLNAGGGEKDVNVSDGEGGSHPDHESLAGFVLRTVTYDGVDGAVLSKTVNTPWHHQTASRTRSWGTVTANLTGASSSRTWTALDGGVWRQTRTNTSFDETTGRPNWVDDLGDVSTAADDRCTRTSYADDTTKWMLAFPSQVETVAVTCADTTPDRANRMISDVRSYYDNGAFAAAPTKGDVTKVEKIASHNGSTATYVPAERKTYDSYGRPLTSTDALNNTTTTAYADTAGLNTKVTVTSPQVTPGVPSSAHVAVQDLDPAWGQPTMKTDVAGRQTELIYDALGRLNKVWLPDHPSDQHANPSLEYVYRVADGQIVAVTTKTLTASGGQRAAIELFDGWLRSRQTQVPGPDGRLITDTFYDDRGQVAKRYAAYSAAGAPEATLFGVGAPGAVETQTIYSYDGIGRVTTERLMSGNNDTQELWRTTTTYGGNRTSVDPPEGGTPTTTVTDARGQTVELRQHKGDTPSGAYDATSYGHTPAGQLASVTDPAGNTWTTTYDMRGRKIETSDPDKGTTTFAHDDLDRLTSTTDARGKKVFTIYDVLGRKTETRDGSPTGTLLTSWLYDTLRKGSLTSATRHVGTNAYTNRVIRYDAVGRPEISAVVVPSAEGNLQGTYTFSANYNMDGTVKTSTSPGAGGLVAENFAHGYDDFLRPTKLSSNLATYVNLAEYTPTGKPQLYELGNTAGKRAWQTFIWEYGTQRLENAVTRRENISGFDRDATYDYDDAGNVLSIADVSRTGTDTQCFDYDYLRRLTEAWTEVDTTCSSTPSSGVVGGVAPYWQSFSYDSTGNRTQEVQHGTGTAADTVRTYTYAPAGQGHELTGVIQTGAAGNRTDTYVYDAAGNTTQRAIGSASQTLDWDTEGELSKVTDSVKGVTSFIYDADGNRLLRKDPTGTTLYLPGLELRLDTGQTTAKGTRYYAFNGTTVAMRTSAGLQFLSADHQGTSQIEINATDQTIIQRRLTPFGAPRASTGTWLGEKGFVGGTIDTTTGYTHLSARDYDPATGRFITVDPLMDMSDPQSWNGYAYAGNSPITFSDPSGLDQGPPGSHCNSPSCWPTKLNPGEAYQVNGGCITCTPDQWGFAGGKRATWQTPAVAANAVADAWAALARQANEARQRAITAQQARQNSSWWLDFNSGFNRALIVGGNPFGNVFSQWAVDQGWLAYTYEEGMDQFLGPHLWPGDINSFAGQLGTGTPDAILAAATMGESQALSLARLLRPCNSFVPGTGVLLANGEYKPIEKIEVGDKVLATDPVTGRTQAKEVLATITGDGQKNLVEVTVDTDGKHGDNTGLVIATDGHPFWVDGDLKKWIKAADIRSGMWLRTSAGTHVQTTTIKTWTKTQHVHNLTVADINTYYVEAGRTAVLVHNTGPCPTGLKNASDGLKSIFDDGGARGKSIIGIRSKLLGSGFTQRLANNKKGYLFRSANGEEVRIMNRGGGWDIRIRNQYGNYLDEFGNVTTPNNSHGIDVYSK